MFSHSTKPSWATLFLLVGMYVLLSGNIFLYAAYRQPLWLHVLISAAAIHLAFTIWHEAAHGNVLTSQRGNFLVGIAGIFPYSTPFFIQRHIHLIHHAKLNQSDDPNQIYANGPFWQIPIRYFRAINFMKKVLANDPRKPFEKKIDQAMTAAIAGIYLTAIVTGHFWDLFVLWTLPVIIAKVVMDWYVNWLPHAGLPPHKYYGTRILDIAWARPLLLNHNYHAIHHLWPQFCWFDYFKVFTERKEMLVQNGVPIESKFTAINFTPVQPVA